VADVHGVAAGKFGHPIAVFIAVEADDFSANSRTRVF
jgi:hypothetical protein